MPHDEEPPPLRWLVHGIVNRQSAGLGPRARYHILKVPFGNVPSRDQCPRDPRALEDLRQRPASTQRHRPHRSARRLLRAARPERRGKSTTIGIVTGLVNKTAGSVRVYGHDTDTALEAAKAEIGLVPQEINFSQFEPVIDIVVNQAGYYGIDRPLARERAEKYLKNSGCGSAAMTARARSPAASNAGS